MQGEGRRDRVTGEGEGEAGKRKAEAPDVWRNGRVRERVTDRRRHRLTGGR